MNDNSPQFTQPQFNVTIAENVTTPLVILKVEAKDADLGPNGEVHYSIVTRLVKEKLHLKNLHF